MCTRLARVRHIALGAIAVTAVMLTACGGGGAEPPSSPGSLPPAVAPGEALAPPGMSPALPPGAQVFYFSDCQAGAQAACVPGDDANPGTSPRAPKRSVAGFPIGSLPAGSQLLFARGGAWDNFHIVLLNLQATPEAPIVLDSYAPAWGGTARPWLRVSFFVGLEFGEYGDTANDGGYTVRNLKLDGQGVSEWGAWLRTTTRNVTLEQLEITGFLIGVHATHEGEGTNTAFTLRKSHIHHNADMGFLGSASDSLIEGNLFEANNFSGTHRSHAIYLSSSDRESRNLRIRGNRLVRNSVVDGVCTGGNLTAHGRWDGLLIEGNTIEQAVSAGGCYGISIVPTYDLPEYFRNTVVRANTIVNLGYIAIAAASAPGILVENNIIVNTRATYQAGVVIPERRPGPGDDADSGAVIRNNTFHFSQPAGWSKAVELRENLGGAGTGLIVVSNLAYMGVGSLGAPLCFAHGALSSFALFDHNLCHHASAQGEWSPFFATLAQAQAAGFDPHGLSADPLFVAPPSAANGWSDALHEGSPARDAGHPTQSSPKDRLYQPRIVPNIGARE